MVLAFPREMERGFVLGGSVVGVLDVILLGKDRGGRGDRRVEERWRRGSSTRRRSLGCEGDLEVFKTLLHRGTGFLGKDERNVSVAKFRRHQARETTRLSRRDTTIKRERHFRP